MEHRVRRQLDRMVDELRAKGCIRSEHVADAFGSVPRHLFLPGVPTTRAYTAEKAIPTHFDENGIPVSSSSAPNIMAVMLEQLSVEPGQRVLEIGTGTGYNAALLSHLVGDTGTVVSLDIDAEVAREAEVHLDAAKVGAVEVRVGDGWLGATDKGKFDRIMATVEAWDIAPQWYDQLETGGILVLPLWLRPGLTVAVAFEKVPTGLVSRSMAYCGFMPLRGPHASGPLRATLTTWPNQQTRAPASGGVVAVLDEATPERVDALQRLLQLRATVTSRPALFAGWNLRLTLEEPDPICFFEVGEEPRNSIGIFDSRAASLALVDGGSILSFGGDSCRQRIIASLERARPLALESLVITALPEPALRSGDADAVLHRPNFDFALRGLSTTHREGA
jgi:protein-L-isoaspartate(D-aspartate) O-methyltransferase